VPNDEVAKHTFQGGTEGHGPAEGASPVGVADLTSGGRDREAVGIQGSAIACTPGSETSAVHGTGADRPSNERSGEGPPQRPTSNHRVELARALAEAVVRAFAAGDPQGARMALEMLRQCIDASTV